MSLLTYLADIHLDLLRATEKCYLLETLPQTCQNWSHTPNTVPLENIQLKAQGRQCLIAIHSHFWDSQMQLTRISGSQHLTSPCFKSTVNLFWFFSSKLNSNLKASRWSPVSLKMLSGEHSFQEMSTGLNTPTQRDPSIEKNDWLRIGLPWRLRW